MSPYQKNLKIFYLINFSIILLQLLTNANCKSTSQKNTLLKNTDNGVVVMSLALNDSIIKKISLINKGDKTQAISLRIVDLKASAESGGIRIFVQKPDANQNTTINISEYITSIFYDSNNKPATYSVSLTNYINKNKLMQNKESLTFTFVFTQAENKKDPSIKLEVRRIEIY